MVVNIVTRGGERGKVEMDLHPALLEASMSAGSLEEDFDNFEPLFGTFLGEA